MLSIAAASSTSFAAPSLAFSSVRASVVKMQEAVAVEEPPTPPPFNPTEFAKTLPGITDPLGFFDPAGFCTEDGASNEKVTEGKIRFYREVELKHSRVAMLAALGFPLAEQFHPLFATDDAPSFTAFQQTPLQTFWPAVVLAIAVPEIFSVFTFEGGTQRRTAEQRAENINPLWSIKKDHSPGDLGFDPLGLKPTSEAELKEMQTKELNNGRLAMIAIAGMVVQEGVT